MSRKPCSSRVDAPIVIVPASSTLVSVVEVRNVHPPWVVVDRDRVIEGSPTALSLAETLTFDRASEHSRRLRRTLRAARLTTVSDQRARERQTDRCASGSNVAR
jgi:hypothetical protein